MLPKRTSQLPRKLDKALHRRQNAFPNIRCQTSLKICGADIRYQLEYHGSDISFMAQISDIRLKNFQTARLNQTQFKEGNCPNKMRSTENQASFQQRTDASTPKKTRCFPKRTSQLPRKLRQSTPEKTKCIPKENRAKLYQIPDIGYQLRFCGSDVRYQLRFVAQISDIS